MQPFEILEALFEDLEHYEELTESTFKELSNWDAFERMLFYGQQYHNTAQRILKLTGTDPRPDDEAE